MRLTEADSANTVVESKGLGRFTFAILGLTMVWFMWDAIKLGIGNPSSPGAGLWPGAVSVGAFILGVLLVIRGDAWQVSPEKSSRWSVFLLSILILYCFLLPLIGFMLATVPVAFSITRWVGGASRVASILTAIFVAVSVYVVFDVLLGVRLVPPGLW